MSRARSLLLLVGLAAGGCVWSDDAALVNFQTEVARDLGPEPGSELDDDAAQAAGQRLLADAQRAPDPEGLTLSQCFRMSIASSEQLRQRAEAVFSADMQRVEAIAAVLPEVAFYGTHVKDSQAVRLGGGRPFQPSERTGYGFTITQTIFDGQLGPKLSIASETRRIEALSLRDDRDQLLYAVAADFYEVLGLQADLDAIEATRASAREALRVLEAREEVGVARADDVLLARASVAEAEARWIQAQADLDRRRARLASELGWDGPLPALRDTYEVHEGPGPIPRLIDLALRQRPDLEAARRSVEQAESREDLAFTELLPKASLTFNHLTESEDGFNSQLDWTLGVNLTWTLFAGGGRVARIAEARAAIRQRQLQLSALEKRVRLEVEDAALAFRALDQALFSFAARARAAAAAHEVTEQLLAAGTATQLELLVARDTREDAARNLTRATLGRKLAALRIRLAAGDMHSAPPVTELTGRR